jgi:hypothetical protein
VTDVPLTKLAVKAILERATAHPWSLQGMGMFRLYLSKEVRLHVWDLRYATEPVSTLHTHPWDFTSEVHSGAITNRLFCKLRETDVAVIRQNASWRRNLAAYNEQQIVCGPGGGVSAPPKEVWLYDDDEDGCLTWTTGDSYSMDFDTIHESIPKTGTVTVLHRRFRVDTEHAFVYYRSDRKWVSAEPRDARPEEVEAMAKMALERWES